MTKITPEMVSETPEMITKTPEINKETPEINTETSEFNAEYSEFNTEAPKIDSELAARITIASQISHTMKSHSLKSHTKAPMKSHTMKSHTNSSMSSPSRGNRKISTPASQFSMQLQLFYAILIVLISTAHQRHNSSLLSIYTAFASTLPATSASRDHATHSVQPRGKSMLQIIINTCISSYFAQCFSSHNGYCARKTKIQYWAIINSWN